MKENKINDTQEKFILQSNVYRFVNVGWLILFFGLFSFVIWAVLAPIDQGVPCQGYVVSDTNRKEIKYLAGGVVSDILIKEGDLVTTNQLLVKMSPVQAESNLKATQDSILGLKEQIKSLSLSLKEKEKQMTYAQKQEKSFSILVNDGFMPNIKLLDSQKEVAQIASSIAETRGSIEKFKKNIDELTEKNRAYQFDLDNTEIKSPVDGYIVGLTLFTKGGMIVPGSHLMDIVPANDDLIIEAQVPVHLIDKVKKSTDVEILFTAFNQSKTPHLKGTVILVSADKYTDERTAASFFKIRATINASEKKYLKDIKIISGMPAEVLVKTGERTLMNYLLKPIFDRSYNALREE